MRVHCLVFEGFSDWEPAFALPELRKNKISIVTVGLTNQAVTSMGGFKVLPDADIYSLDPSEIKTLIIPGGSLWEEKIPLEFLSLVQKLNSLNTNLAAICGATLVLAEAGLLNNIQHTSNHIDYLKSQSTSYKGEKNYRADQLACHDHNIITASGLGAIEFAKILFLALQVYSTKQAEQWFDFFKHAKF